MSKYPPVPLGVWYKFRPEELQFFVGRDIIIYRQNRYYTMIKEATMERILQFLDDTSHIVDLTDAEVIQVEYVGKKK